MCEKTPRARWTSTEIWALLRLWEQNLDGLRKQKRNGAVYQKITAALNKMGFSKAKKQVHSKIENLGHTYRMAGLINKRNHQDPLQDSMSQQLSTETADALKLSKDEPESANSKCEFFEAMHRFLGGCPANEAVVTKEEEEDTNSWDTTQLRVISGSPHSSTEDNTEEWIIPISSDVDEDVVITNQQDKHAASAASTLTITDSVGCENSECIPNNSYTKDDPLEKPQKKARLEKTLEPLVQELRSLRQTIENTHKRELEVRERELQLQEESHKLQKYLLDTLARFLPDQS
ncbi:uncharacterized protein LOC135371672 isoform X1 [Ornithodoros turicata]|uniref:uncharacterized protein LOC135371672 isoform X1 n=1 Tax=Ornithodoros turicata TaxID=34597 RepID=UPI003139EDCA